MDESFVEAAMSEHGGTVLRAAVSVTGSRWDAEDVFSDVFFALYKYGGGFYSRAHLKAWLIRVALNKAKNVKKSAFISKRAELTENIPASGTGTDGGGAVLNALQKLKARERAIVYLHYYEGYSLKEIAPLMSLREGSVRSALSRARADLKELLSDDCFAE